MAQPQAVADRSPIAKQSSVIKRATLSVGALALINVCAIASLRGLPAQAEYGLGSIFYYVLAAIVFLIPTSLVAAELAAGWPEQGGVFRWVSEAFGDRWGFMAIWLEWLQNTIWYPTVLTFAAATVAFILNDPALANDKVYTLAIVLAVYWGATLVNFRGMKTSGWISSAGVTVGTLIPGAIMILLGIIWLLQGNPSAAPVNASALIPNLSGINNLVLASGILLYFAGMEMSAVHVKDVENPQRDYPKAIILAAVIVLATFILGTLAIAFVVPAREISLVAGLMQAFQAFFEKFGMAWAVPIVGVMVAFGVFGQVATWVVGPSKGLLTVARDGYMPPFFQKVNKEGVQINILIVQALIVTLLSLMFVVLPSVSSSYWILSALTVQLYLIMYVLMFAAAIKLRYSQPDVKRSYRVPGGQAGMWIVAGLGILGALAAGLLGFVPPSQLGTGSPVFYVGFLIIGNLVACAIPLIIYHLRRPEWKQETATVTEASATGNGNLAQPQTLR